MSNYAVEPSVLCQVMDEVTTDWQKNRYTVTMPLSSSATDLYSLVAKKAGVCVCGGGGSGGGLCGEGVCDERGVVGRGEVWV